MSVPRGTPTTVIEVVRNALKAAHSKFPEAVKNEMYQTIVKKNFVGNGADAFLQLNKKPDSQVSLGFAVASMLIDSYYPSSPIPPGTFDKRDPKIWLRNVDIINGCKRSLVKYFANQIPCNCLDEIHSQIKSTMPKTGKCIGCKQRKERSSFYICTVCERVQYCSKACQIAHVPKHKSYCKLWQNDKWYSYSLH